jgi:hypothetical protein
MTSILSGCRRRASFMVAFMASMSLSLSRLVLGIGATDGAERRRASTSCTGLQLNSFWIFKAYLLSHPDLLFACSELLFSCRLRAVSVTICSGQILTCLYRTPFIELCLNLLPCRIYITSRHHLPHFCYFLGSLLILLRSFRR